MPTYRRSPRFIKDHGELGATEKKELRKAIDLFVEGLAAGSGRFHPSLRVHRLASTADVWSLSWGKGGRGRATFRFGKQVRPGEPHVEWLGVTADHSLYKG
jgi:hypothetical protein